MERFTHVIVGGGLAAASAVEGIREVDSKGSILLVGAETELPYDRPPLSKQLWSGATTKEQLFRHDQDFYRRNAVELRLGAEVTSLDPRLHVVRDSQGDSYQYSKALLATGGTPRRLAIPGGDLDGISYFRTLGDYKKLRSLAQKGKSALVVGGGFIGSELAAALSTAGLTVTMIFPGEYLGGHVFPESLGRALTAFYHRKGVEIFEKDVPVEIRRDAERYETHTRSGRKITSDMVVVGIGITPNISLAQTAGLETGNGIVVNEQLQTSDPDIYAAGDVAFFPESVLGSRRIEHWDNAASQGKHAGRNMAGAGEPFTYLPFFFSDLFEFGYEAVGDVDARYGAICDWQEENKTGVIYYLHLGRMRGIMMCNLFGKVDEARKIILRSEVAAPLELRGAIK